MKRILGALRRADERFHLIDNGDRIAVGLSGGKDSMLLLHALTLYRLFSKREYDIEAICVDLGFGNYDTETMSTFCAGHEVPFHVVDTQIGEIVFKVREEKNPCSLCSKMRKGALYRKAAELRCSKAAFGHHMDDVLETFLMNLMFAGQMATFSPKAYLTRSGITLIRPFIFLREWDIKGTVRKLEMPVAKNPCPQDKLTNRQNLKNFLRDMDGRYPHASTRIATAISNTATYDLWCEEDEPEAPADAPTL